jgi:hypothetical protein
MALLVAGRATTLIAVAGVALMIAAPPALAVVTASTDGLNTVIIESDEAADAVNMSCDVGEANVNGTSALPALACDAVTNVLVDAEDGASTVNLGNLTLLDFPLLTRTTTEVADTDADVITGSEARDVVRADFLDDVSTGPGDDWVEGAGSADGGEGNDTLREISSSVRGGSGDDLIVGGPAVLIDGGSGVDSVVIDFAAFTSQTTVSLSITDASINGATSTSGIEAYDVTASDGVRADGIDSRLYSGRMSFHGRAGNDSFLGGPGADLADLGLGNDVVDTGPGSDFVLTGEGDDTIAARDGFGDVVECGPGSDTVTADRADVLSGCENVALPAPETSRIAGTKKLTKGTKAFFTFAASVPSATFECQLDAGSFTPCASPYKLKTKKLKIGKHTLTVRAVQPAGNADATPSTFKFKVLPKD